MNTQINDEASEWLIELQTEEPSRAVRERFASWLDTSPEHVRAFLEVTSLWEDASGVDRHRAVDVDSLIASAQSERNLFPLDLSSGRDPEVGASRGPWAQSQDTRPRWRSWALAASIAVLGIGTAAAWYWNSHLRGLHSTGIGEQTTLALSDGSTVELNAGTRIRERFTKTERAVEMLQGQALFRVTKDPSRPFVVRSDTVVVRAIGTQFDVLRRASGTRVTVLEGRVAVAPIVRGSAVPELELQQQAQPSVPERTASTQNPTTAPRAQPASDEFLLDAGQQINLDRKAGSATPQLADMKVATAWTEQRLVFDSANLVDAAEEFNRFNATKLIVDPQGLDDFKVSGTFEALDSQSLERFVRFLRDQGLTVTQRDDSFRIAKNR